MFQQLNDFVSRICAIIAENGFQLESASTCYTFEIFFFWQGICKQVSGSTTSGLCTDMLRAVGSSIFVSDADPMMKMKIVATLLTQRVCFLDSGERECIEKNIGVCRSA